MVRGSLSLGWGLVSIRTPVGEFLIETSTTVSSTVSLRLMRSRWRGLRPMSSPHRRPVLIAVSTINRCCAGRAVRMATYSVGVSVRSFFLTALGSSVLPQG